MFLSLSIPSIDHTVPFPAALSGLINTFTLIGTTSKFSPTTATLDLSKFPEVPYFKLLLSAKPETNNTLTATILAR